MKHKILACFLFLALLGSVVGLAGCGGDLPGDAVAKVGDKAISEKDFEKRVKSFASQYGLTEEAGEDVWNSFRTQVLDYLVTYEIASQKANALGVSVTDDELQEELDNIVQLYFNGDKDAFEEDLKARGMTLEDLETTYKESMLLQKVYEKVTQGITEVPEEEIQAYYEAHKTDFYVEETRTARHILIAPDGKETNDATSGTSSASTTSTTGQPTDADWEKALATAKKVRALLVAGGDWKELAARYSDDPGTANNGGELGAIKTGEMVPEFEEAVFSLAVNEISQPVRTSYGYHIIQVTAIDEAHQLALEEVKDTIKATLLEQKKAEAWRQWLEQTKQEIGVTYREDMQPTTTTTEATSTTSSSAATEPSATTSSSGLETTTTKATQP
ncbi:MAG: peptidylprolyl isomerase [Thermoleophilia bacterium]|nr:peptidylprolyl isomerase [Thermoleophilia bacterium]